MASGPQFKLNLIMEYSGMESIQASNEDSRKVREKLSSLAWLKKKLDTDDKPFKCKECPKKYANNGTLYRHKLKLM